MDSENVYIYRYDLQSGQKNTYFICSEIASEKLVREFFSDEIAGPVSLKTDRLQTKTSLHHNSFLR